MQLSRASKRVRYVVHNDEGVIMIFLMFAEITMIVSYILNLLYLKQKYKVKYSKKWLLCSVPVAVFAFLVFIMWHVNINRIDMFAWSASLGILLGMSCIDYKERYVDKWLMLILLAIAVITLARIDYWVSINKIVALFVFGLFILIVSKISKQVGMGDVKVIAIMSLLFGLNSMFSIMFYALMISLIYGVAYIKLKKKNMKEEIPFIPFLLIGVITNIGMMWI